VNIPAISDYLGFLTDKDLSDLDFVCGQDVDMVAVSFVKNRKNITDLRKIINSFISKNNRLNRKRKRTEIPWIISKIERKDALRNLDGIIDESDGIMVARGDLAIEVPQEKVAILQKDIIKKCLKAKKPVIVATQMMASMVENNRPTRAEISDISNAVIDQTDAIMFSNETAVGRYPIKVIETADKIIREAEKSSYNDKRLKLTNRFARMLFHVKEDKRRRSVKAKSLKELLEYSSLRQEKVSLCLDSRSVLEKRKASLIWGSR
jgi:pyruvate kinase